MGHYSEGLVKKVQAIIDTDKKAPVTKWLEVVEVLKAGNIMYTVHDVSPKQLLVHPDNRAKLGVNAFNCHRTGAYIKRVGADLEMLTKATAFELSAVESCRTHQLGFNEGLVRNAAGMLAPINGGERYASVSCRHTVQFCKAALAGCRTPEASVADSSGNIDVQVLTKDDQAFASMLKGWSWSVLPWQVEQTWPQLPDLAQRALNASNSVASVSSELEVASMIAEFAQMQSTDSDGNVEWSRCIEAATSSSPACADYVDVLGRYVRLFGGGTGAP